AGEVLRRRAFGALRLRHPHRPAGQPPVPGRGECPGPRVPPLGLHGPGGRLPGGKSHRPELALRRGHRPALCRVSPLSLPGQPGLRPALLRDLSRPCLNIGNVTNGEGFFRQTRRFDAAILCVSQGKSTPYGGKSSAIWHVDIFQTRPKGETYDMMEYTRPMDIENRSMEIITQLL